MGVDSLEKQKINKRTETLIDNWIESKPKLIKKIYKTILVIVK